MKKEKFEEERRLNTHLEMFGKKKTTLKSLEREKKLKTVLEKCKKKESKLTPREKEKLKLEIEKQRRKETRGPMKSLSRNFHGRRLEDEGTNQDTEVLNTSDREMSRSSTELSINLEGKEETSDEDYLSTTSDQEQGRFFWDEPNGNMEELSGSMSDISILSDQITTIERTNPTAKAIHSLTKKLHVLSVKLEDFNGKEEKKIEDFVEDFRSHI